MATRATIKQIERDGLTLTPGAKELLPVLYGQLSSLPDWGSAREVYRNILPAMYSKRANRLGQLARIRRMEEEAAAATGGGGGGTAAAAAQQKPAVAPTNRRAAAKAKADKPVPDPYDESDVRNAFQSSIQVRLHFRYTVCTLTIQ